MAGCGSKRKKPMGYAKGGMTFKPCAKCPTPAKCKKAGKCMKKAAARTAR
jgi:hypothetical protein